MTIVEARLQTRRRQAGLKSRLYILALVLLPATVNAQYGASNGEWRTYGGDLKRFLKL